MGVHQNNKSDNSEHEGVTMNPTAETAATFEEAITATGFGKFNYLLLFIIFFPSIAQLLNTVELSYVLPVAQCDLELSLEDKGFLNGAMFAGMITSGLFWGYISDALGRKRIIVYGYLVTGVFAVTAALATNKTVLMVAKLLSGVFINGPYSAGSCHIIEFHSNFYRGRVNLAKGIFISIGNLLLPVLAWAILPRKWDFSFFGLYELHSWNILLLICASTTIISSVLYTFVPESPKFLMATGRTEEALNVMKKIYALNSGQSQENFPVKSLVEETTNKKKVSKALKDGFMGMGKMFHKPQIFYICLGCFNAFSLIMSSNTLKLWLPQIFQAINDYQYYHNDTNSICVMLDELKPHQENFTTQNCFVNLENISVYINTFIVAATRILMFALSDYFLQLLGVKTLTVVTCFLCAGLNSSIYFARSSQVVTALAATGTATASVAENVLIALTLELFPTNLRAIALSIQLTAGRIGTLVGSAIFPYLLLSGCLPPFMFIGLFGSACGLVSLFYTSVKNKPLE
ncbi:unnamed protein product [Phyllotreta striolata]|uniref:Major facilitator superfamily (MFS) profile domain-containing protein n=1 Tax=Phyllotreta striolata TaxID=444603 RepID=A0A9N9TMV0_PHYSR|nr:unnamed protein product [Phyllotreta striolata]